MHVLTFVELKSYSHVAHHTPQPQSQAGQPPQGGGQTAGEVAASHALNGSPSPTLHSQGSPASAHQHYTTYTSAASYSYPSSTG